MKLSLIYHMGLMLLCLVLVAANQALALEGPDYVPPFEAKGAMRQDAKLTFSSFLDSRNGNKPAESASLVVGNKRISVREFASKEMNTMRDQLMTIFVNDTPVFEIIFSGSYQNAQKQFTSFIQGYDIKNVMFEKNVEYKTIRWSNRYQLPDGTSTAFYYQLKDLGKSKIELSWNMGCTKAQIQHYEKAGNRFGGVIMYFSSSNAYRKDGIKINNHLVKLHNENELKQNKAMKLPLWAGELKRVDYNPGKPLNSFSLISEGGLNGVSTELFNYGRMALGFQLNSTEPQGHLVIDLGETAIQAYNATPPVEGHDFWAADALHYPTQPVRNLFPNPSFDQGLRYWRWWSGGAYYTRSDVPRYQIDDTNGCFGKRSLVVNPTQQRSAALMSFSLPSKKAKTYTISFYAKAQNPGAQANLGLFSTKRGGQFDRNHVNDTPMQTLTDQWQRFSQTFVSDGAPFAAVLKAQTNGGKIWIDGIQFEQNNKATDFVSAPLQGELLTSEQNNNVEYGHALNAIFEIRGEKSANGQIELTLMDFYKKPIWSKLFTTHGGEKLSLPFDSLNLSTGVYILRTQYTLANTAPYEDYYRFTIIDSMDGKQATKNLYGALFMSRVNRTEDICKLMQRLGYAGSTSYGSGKSDPMNYELRDQFNITDYTHTLMEGVWLTPDSNRFDDPDYLYLMSLNPRIWRRPEMKKTIKIKDYYYDDDVKRIEDIAYRCAKAVPQARVWSFGTEEEILLPPIVKRKDYKEVAKLLVAFYRGIKRANPDAIVLPSGGTSGYGKVRGYDAIEGYLSSTQGLVKWDAVAVHPYGACDGTLGQTDLDETIQMLSDSMKKFGYGKETPIYFNEGGGQGSPARWGDGPDYTYVGGQPSYDQGLREYIHACKLARQYIICLKYWPRLEHYNCWMFERSEIVDYNLTPTSGLLGINTLNHLLGNPKFVSNLRPSPGMREYSFADEKGVGVAALWCTNDDVERGFIRGPVMSVKFAGEIPEMIDLMGKRYELKPDQDGYVKFQLTSAPFFLRGGNPQELASVLKDAVIMGAGSSVQITFKPALDGKIKADVINLTSDDSTGSIVINQTAIPFSIAGNKSKMISFPASATPGFGQMFHWNKTYQIIQSDVAPLSQEWKMDYFYVPRVQGEINWDKIPAIKMDNLYRPMVDLKQTPGGQKGDIAASFKLAWDPSNLYLHVEVEDNIFNTDYPKFWSSTEAQKNLLYLLDGCMEVYFDCGANGRLHKSGYDLDDYRYDFCPGNPQGESGPGLVNRQHEVFNEYAGGVEFPTKEEVANSIKCQFTRISKTKYAYTIMFAQRYLEPMQLKTGTVAGFGMYIHDRMDDGKLGHKGMSLATEPGSHCDQKPNVWPLMVLMP